MEGASIDLSPRQFSRLRGRGRPPGKLLFGKGEEGGGGGEGMGGGGGGEEEEKRRGHPDRVLVLLVHRLHDGSHDPGKDRTTARAADRIAEKPAQRPARSRIGTRSTPNEGTEKCSSSDPADRTANDLGQLAHRHLLQDRADGVVLRGCQ